MHRVVQILVLFAQARELRADAGFLFGAERPLVDLGQVTALPRLTGR
jgi:hypothetical protein